MKSNTAVITPYTTEDLRLQALESIGVIDNALNPIRKVQFMLVTPEIATIMLQCNVINRPARGHWVCELKNMIRRGKFSLSNDAICFNLAGFLSNAQHRLKAVIETGVACEFIVAYGVEFTPDMDTGLKRTLLDNIKLYGYGIHNDLRNKNIVSVAQNCCRYMSKTSNASYDEVIEFILHYHQDLMDFHDIITQKKGSTWHKTALFMMYIGDIDTSITYHAGTPVKPTLNECKEFYSVFVADCSTKPVHNPIRALHTATGELFANGYGGSDAHKKEIISIVQDAMNQFLMSSCTNNLYKYTQGNMYKYDCSFLNIDINGTNMDEKKYK